MRHFTQITHIQKIQKKKKLEISHNAMCSSNNAVCLSIPSMSCSVSGKAKYERISFIYNRKKKQPKY